MIFWLTIISMGLVTFAIRLLPILALDRFPIPPRLRQALRYVPPAVLSAIIFPELFIRDKALDISFSNERLLAGLFAIALAVISRNVLFTIGAGMLTLWFLQWLGV